jgi:hypothetical protein
MAGKTVLKRYRDNDGKWAWKRVPADAEEKKEVEKLDKELEKKETPADPKPKQKKLKKGKK